MVGKFWYVYILKSLHGDHYYVGITEDMEERLKKHNAGAVVHTSKYLPWRIETAAAFRDKDKASSFEKYLKSQSGRAFAKKHF